MITVLAFVATFNPSIKPEAYADQSIPARFRGKTVLNKPKLFTEKVIALTFDDGPDKKITPLILDSLKNEGAKATFFILGRNASMHPELLKRQVDEGHVVGSHTWNHLARPAQNKAGAEVWNTAQIIYKATGQWPSIFRPPYGIDTSWPAMIAKREGYASVLWNKLGPDTVKAPSSGEISRRVIAEASPGDIVLFHDGYGKIPTASAIPVILQELKKKGYTFVTVPEMLKKWDSHIFAMEQKSHRDKLAKNPTSRKGS